MNHPTYLVHYNPNHDPKTGQFTYSPGSTILPKGTRLNSVSSKYLDAKKYRKNGRWMYTYRPDEKWDTKVYEGPFSLYLQYAGAQFIKRFEYVTTKDLNMPTKEERVNEFKNLLDDKKFGNILRNELSVAAYRYSQFMGSEKDQKRFAEFNPNNIKTKKDFDTAYEIFSHMMENGHSNKSTKEYSKRMAEKWDAMVDDNNVGIYNRAVDPIIVFKADKFLKEVGKNNASNFLTSPEIIENVKDVRKELEKYKEEVKL